MFKIGVLSIKNLINSLYLQKLKKVKILFFTALACTQNKLQSFFVLVLWYQTYLELVQQLFNDLVCGHSARDTNFSWCTKARSEDRGLWNRVKQH